jgi:hypothetical protein
MLMVANVETALGRPAFEFPPPRSFGRERSDLDFDFEAEDRPALSTAIVAACTQGAGRAGGLREQAWALPVGTRVARLLRIVELTIESAALPITRNCSAAPCGRPFEVGLPFDRLHDVSAGETVLAVTLPHGPTLQLRRPTGRDQQAWRAQDFSTRREALALIVQTLIVSAPEAVRFDDEAISALAGAMEEFDPLTAFRVITTCPHCEVEATFAVDLEAEALRLFSAHQRALLRNVHALATQYGWNEAEIVALSPRRRAHYLRMTEATNAASL